MRRDRESSAVQFGHVLIVRQHALAINTAKGSRDVHDSDTAKESRIDGSHPKDGLLKQPSSESDGIAVPRPRCARAALPQRPLPRSHRRADLPGGGNWLSFWDLRHWGCEPGDYPDLPAPPRGHPLGNARALVTWRADPPLQFVQGYILASRRQCWGQQPPGDRLSGGRLRWASARVEPGRVRSARGNSVSRAAVEEQIALLRELWTANWTFRGQEHGERAGIIARCDSQVMVGAARPVADRVGRWKLADVNSKGSARSSPHHRRSRRQRSRGGILARSDWRQGPLGVDGGSVGQTMSGWRAWVRAYRGEHRFTPMAQESTATTVESTSADEKYRGVVGETPARPA